MRWRLAIQEFDFTVAYIKGEMNNVADGMSRCLPETMETDTTEQPRPTLLQYLSGEVEMFPILTTVPPEWYDHLDRENRQQYHVPSQEVSLFCSILADGPVPIKQFEAKSHCKESGCSRSHTTITTVIASLINGDSTELLPVQARHQLAQHELAPNLPTNIQEILESVHNAEVGHGGVERTLELIVQLRAKEPRLNEILDNWYTKRADTKRFVKQCPICQKVKSHQLLKYTPHYVLNTYGIFDNVSIDTIYMPENSRGVKYLLVLIDSFSRYLGVYPISDLSAQTALEVMIKWMSDFGIPSHLCCDNGSQFRGIFEELLNLLNVNHYTIHAYSH